jgi:hypothetical protein
VPAPQSSAAPASSSASSAASSASSAASSEAPAPAPAPAPAVDPAELGYDPFWYPEFEIAVPEPPFKSSASENGSDILVINADSGEEITYPEMLNDCGLLMDLGYDNVAVLVSFEDEFTAAHKAAGAATLFEAKNAAGQTVRVYKEESTWMVFAPRFDSDAEPKSSDTSDTPAPAADAWMYDNHLMPIPEPPYGYSVDIGRESYEIRTENVDEVRTGTIKDITD